MWQEAMGGRQLVGSAGQQVSEAMHASHSTGLPVLSPSLDCLILVFPKDRSENRWAGLSVACSHVE